MQIRTTCPSGNKYYIREINGGYNGAIQGKPTRAGANVLSNCVGYANGRFAEIIGKEKCEYQMVCNASGFVERAKRFGLQVVSYPTLGGIMCWAGGSTGAGHVAIVERLDSAIQFYSSESCWGGSAFYNAIRNNSNGRWGMGSAYTFLGCIINPAIGDVHWEDSQTSTTKYVCTKNDPLNVRSTPNGAIIGSLAKGTQVSIVGEDAGWSKINSPKDGWVSSQYLGDNPPTGRNTVGQIKELKANVKIWSNPDLTGTSWNYLKGTKVKILENVSNDVDKIYIPATGRTAYINIAWYN